MFKRCRDVVAWAVLVVLMLAGAGSTTAAQTPAEPTVVVEGGASEYVIYHSPDAPSSVVEAGEELQHYLAEATGAKLPVVAQAQPPEGHFISLGGNAAAQAVDLSADGVAPGGFRIVTRAGNLYILGPDTPGKSHLVLHNRYGPDTPTGNTTPRGGVSAGTRNGVYTFLEDYLDIRWLMPGPLGEDVPHTDRLALPVIDRTETPGFANRRIPYIQNERPEVQTWLRRNRQGYSLQLNHGHNWIRTVPAELYDEHPEWFAQIGDTRPRPEGRYKLETTNPELVRHYADQVIKAFRENENLYAYSLSPSDSRGWSTSAASQALYDEDPHGELSVTPMIITFYNEVARLVRAEFPDRIVCGYIYADFLYPPSDGIPPLEPNLFLVVAPHIDYGYQLYRPQTRADFEQIMGAWSQATDNIAYYDLPNWLRQSIGAPNPPGLEILAYIYPRLVKYDIKGIYIYGNSAWGHAAVGNYLLARLNWAPHADVHALAKEFFHRFYGSEAGPIMGELYSLLDEQMKQHYLSRTGASYTLDRSILQNVYANNFPRIEALFLRAKAAATEPKHRERLALFEKNLVLMRWNLIVRGMIEGDEDSPLARNDEQIKSLMKTSQDNLAMIPTRQELTSKLDAQVDPVQVSLGEGPLSNAQSRQRLTLRGPQQVLLYPTADQEATFEITRMALRDELLQYVVHDSLGNVVTQGVLARGEPVRFFGKERQAYFLDIQAQYASYELRIRGCRYAFNAAKGELGFHMLQETAPLYFYVPESTETFNLTLTPNEVSPGERSAADVLSPNGETVASLDNSSLATTSASINTSGHGGGFWAVVFKQPQTGVVDDVYLKLGEMLPQWVLTDPTAPILIRQP